MQHFSIKVIVFLSMNSFSPGQFVMLSKSTFSKNSFRNTIRLANSLDPDQGRRPVGPDLGPSCSQMLSADDTSRQIVEHVFLGLNKSSHRYGSFEFSQHVF